VNPMAAWSHRDVAAYLQEHDLPHNPLYDLGYSSIGCAPCTRMRLPDEPERAGRWAGLSKWECGIQVTPDGVIPVSVDAAQATTQRASGAS
jgi:phosphoadenosine phosphosulfate reductase